MRIKLSILFVLVACFCVAFTFRLTKNNTAPATLKAYKDQQITVFFNRETGWIASDGGYSFPIGDGKVMWTYGDSFTNDYDPATQTVPCLFNVRNCAMVQPLNDWDWRHTPTLLSTSKSTFLRSNPADNHFNWPGAGFQLKDTAYVICFNLKNVTTGMGFASAGPDVLAKIKLPEMTVATYHSLQDFGGINFTLGFVKDDTDGFVYAFGQKTPSFGVNNIYVARFPESAPNANWQFWNGNGWGGSYKAAAVIGSAPSNSSNICKIKNKYLLFSSEFSLGCDGGKNIYVQVSDKLSGPFSKPKTIYTIDDTLKGHYPFFYLPIAHPEYINDKNELLLTYSINGYGNCVNTCINGRFNPNYYRPRGIRIPLKLIDPAL